MATNGLLREPDGRVRALTLYLLQAIETYDETQAVPYTTQEVLAAVQSMLRSLLLASQGRGG